MSRDCNGIHLKVMTTQLLRIYHHLHALNLSPSIYEAREEEEKKQLGDTVYNISPPPYTDKLINCRQI